MLKNTQRYRKVIFEPYSILRGSLSVEKTLIIVPLHKVLQMLKKGNKLYSILTGSCPRCHEESMYLDKNPYHLGKIFEMHERCSTCDLKYKIEPSFFYGAMYVSYGVGIAFAVAAFVIAKLFIGADLIQTFIAIVLTMIVFMPVIMRLSRNIWINIFVKYNPKTKLEKSVKN